MALCCLSYVLELNGVYSYIYNTCIILYCIYVMYMYKFMLVSLRVRFWECPFDSQDRWILTVHHGNPQIPEKSPPKKKEIGDLNTSFMDFGDFSGISLGDFWDFSDFLGFL